MFLFGGGITVWLIVEKLYRVAHHLTGREITAQPLFYIALVLVILGVQLFLAGFLGELVSRSSSDRNHYLIEKTVG